MLGVRAGGQGDLHAKTSAQRSQQEILIIPSIGMLCVCVCVLVSHVQFFATPWTVACQALLSMGFSRQEHWSGLSFPSPIGMLRAAINQSSTSISKEMFYCLKVSDQGWGKLQADHIREGNPSARKSKVTSD